MKTRSNSAVSALAQVAGRSRWRVEDAEVVLGVWRESGVSVSAFARRHGIQVERLLRWRRRLQQAGRLEFHPVKLVSSASQNEEAASGSVELVLRNERRVVVHRGFDAGLLEEVVQAAESWSC